MNSLLNLRFSLNIIWFWKMNNEIISIIFTRSSWDFNENSSHKNSYVIVGVSVWWFQTLIKLMFALRVNDRDELILEIINDLIYTRIQKNIHLKISKNSGTESRVTDQQYERQWTWLQTAVESHLHQEEVVNYEWEQSGAQIRDNRSLEPLCYIRVKSSFEVNRAWEGQLQDINTCVCYDFFGRGRYLIMQI